MFGIFLWKEDCLCYYWSPVSNFYLMPIHLNEMKNAFKSEEGIMADDELAPNRIYVLPASGITSSNK